MALKDKLEIILITYNRKKYLERTFSYIFADDSPIKDLNITILNNKSDDGTSELVDEYAKVHTNLTHIINNCNIGGNGNIAKAFEMAKFPYIWIMCDDDTYDWSSFDEIEQAIEEDYDLISTQHYEFDEPSKRAFMFRHLSFVPGAIHKTENITHSVMANIMYNICNLFPQYGLIAHIFNENKNIFWVSKSIVIANYENYSYGHLFRDINYLHPFRISRTFTAGFVNSTMLIKDKNFRYQIIDNMTFFSKSLFGHLYNEFLKNKLAGADNFINFSNMFFVFNFRQKLILLAAYLAYFLSYNLFVNRILPELKTKSHYKQYFENIDFHKTLKRLKHKYKNKKIVIYGAGMAFDAIKENYDLTELNIAAISDKKFEKEEVYNGYIAVPPSKIKELEPDVIFVGIYNIEVCLDFIKSLNIKYEYLAKVPCHIHLHKLV